MVPIKAIDRGHMRGNFSSHAVDYDRYASVQKRVVALLSAKISALTTQPGLMLDVGTGTGALAAALLDKEGPQQLVVMDIAHGMTRQAIARLPEVIACDGDASCLPFAGETFSLVVSSSVYQWLGCLTTAFTEVSRVLKPGGLFAMALFGEQTLFELRAAHQQSVVEHQKKQASHVQSFPTRQEVSANIDGSGLVCRELLSVMELEYHADVPELLRQLKQIGASNASADRPRGLASRKVMQTMIKQYEESYRCDLGLPASYEVIVAIAEKPR